MDGEEIYLGDGAYASSDGVYIKLRAPREDPETGRVVDHVVYLDPGMLTKVVELADRVWGRAEGSGE